MNVLTRRHVLRLTGVTALGLLGVACSTTAPAAQPTTPPAPAATTAPVQAAASSPGWDQMVAAAQSEGKVVVSGPPAPDARTKLPAAFKARFNIEMEKRALNRSEEHTSE